MEHDIAAESVEYVPVTAIKSITEKPKEGKLAVEGQFFSGMINANVVDVQRERYDPAGVDTKAFMACGGPVFAPSHYNEMAQNGLSLVVASVRSLSRTPEGLRLNKAEFDVGDPLSDHYRGKVHRGFIRAMSAGFQRLAWDYEGKDANEVRVVTKSRLVHVILTSHPANHGALIDHKSMMRVDQLAKDLEEHKAKSFVPVERFEELAESIRALTEKMEQAGASKVDDEFVDDPAPEEASSSEHDPALVASALLFETAYLAAHPELPDAAFIVEHGAEKEGGKVLRKYRHLPHHTSAVKSPTEHTSVNKALLRNALARVNQVQCAKEDSAAFRKRAEAHLRAHARALGIGSKE